MRRDSGYVLIFLLVAVALLVIVAAAAAPRLAQQVKRDREIEMIHRGEQYARAIKKYYKKFGRYPARIEDLENTNNIRFLRKRYKDPMSQDGTWKLVRFGEVQLGQAGGGGLGTVPASGQQPQPLGGQQTSGTGQQQTGLGRTGGGTTGGTGQSGIFGQPLGGQQFGGGPILGVASKNEKTGIHEFDNKRRYNQWLFVYDPTMDRGGLIKGPYNPKAFVGAGGGIGQPAGQPPGQLPGTGPGSPPAGGPGSPPTSDPGGTVRQ